MRRDAGWWPDAEADVAVALGTPVSLHAVTTPAGIDDLSDGERRRLPPGDGLRGRDWLLGRAALKPLVEGADTSGLRFPHRRFSVTHAAGVSVAVRADGDQAGVGVDYERWRATDRRIARFFLQEGESGGAIGDPGDLLRLWTVKEALFKATPDNSGAMLLDYEVADPAAWRGEAADRGGHSFRYVSGVMADGWLTVAVCDASP